MNRSRSSLRFVGALTGALLELLALILVLQGGARAEGTGTDPAVGAITATASIPISDTCPYQGISRTIYFNNISGGLLTLTLEITGTTPLILTPGGAFGDSPDVITSETTSWLAVVTYTVWATDTNDYPGVLYTVTNGAGAEVAVAITYTRDVTAPQVTISFPPSGAILTTVHQSEVAITGTASDDRSGVAWVDVTTDGTNWYSATGTANWSYNWSLPEVDGQVYTLTARAWDHAGNWGTSANVTVTVDIVAPEASAPNPHRSPWVTSTVVYTWDDSSDASGISYWVNITNTVGYTAFFWTNSPVLTFTGALTEGAGYYARVQAVDGVGNAGDWSAPSIAVTPDLTAPTVVVTAPAQIATSNFTVSWSAMDNLSGPSSTYSVYYRENNGPWQVWLDSTTLTQATFVSGTLGHTYVFSVTAMDRAGNVGQGAATTKVAKWRVYIPLTLRNWVWWYEHDPYEPNDTPPGYGPLTSGQTIQAYIWDATDRDDYYWFRPSSNFTASISLTNIPSSCDFDLYVYTYVSGNYQLVARSDKTGNADESVSFPVTANTTYYIRVYSYQGSSSQQPYRLSLSLQ